MMKRCFFSLHCGAIGWVAVLLCCVVVGAGFASGSAAAQDEALKYFYYSTVENLDDPRGAPNIHLLTMSTEKIGVMFEEGLSDMQQGEVLAAHGQVGDVAKDGVWRYIRHERPMLVVPLRDVKASDEIGVLLDNLMSDPGVVLATPVFQVAPGHDELLTDEFFASFPAKTAMEEIEKLNGQYGVEVVYTRDWPIIGKVGYRLRVTDKSDYDALEMANLYYEHPLTVRATPDFISLYPIANTTPNDTYYDNQWPLPIIEAPDAWDSETGSSDITIAILDTGVDLDHEDLDAKLLRDQSNNIIGKNFTVDPPDNNFDDDDMIYGGHGTKCASVAAAETNNNQGVAGLSWGAAIMPLKVINGSTGFGDEEDIASAIAWAANNGAHVISMSTGSPLDTDEESTECENAKAMGCVLVASAGNDTTDSARYPAAYPEVICVGASNSSDMRCVLAGSNWGPHLDVMAPAEYDGTPAAAKGGGYTTDFGCTSAACPEVAGLAALVLSTNAGLSPSQVQAIIQFSADDLAYVRLVPPELAIAGRDEITGYGRINCAKALELAQAERFVIADTDGDHLASVDEAGNFVLEGNGFSQDSVDADVLTSTELSAELQASALHNEFILRDGSGTILARLTADEDPLWDNDGIGDRDDDDDGLVDEMMFIRGRLYERVDIDLDTVVTNPSLRIKGSDGDTVALINSQEFANADIEPDSPHAVLAGSLILKGRAFIGVNPDREQSQGR